MTVTRFTEDDVRALAADAKIGLLGTRDAEGRPHVTLITTLEAKGPDTVMWGQFCGGLSKDHVEQDPRTGFLVMTTDKFVWRGHARWTHKLREGDDFERYNQKPIYRYNSYFGIHTVHYMDLVDLEPRRPLSMPRIIGGTVVSTAARPFAWPAKGEPVLKPWAVSHLGKATTLKFLAYVNDDGFPSFVPVVPCHTAGTRRLVVAGTTHGRELTGIASGADVALFGLNFEMESVLVRGRWSGLKGIGPLRTATVDIDWVYNSMPPVHGQIYPPQPLQAVREF